MYTNGAWVCMHPAPAILHLPSCTCHPHLPFPPPPLVQATKADGAHQLHTARSAAERDLAAALGTATSEHEARMRACVTEYEEALARARDVAAAAALDRDRQDGERARVVSLEQLEWMRERQQGEEGAWVFVAHFVPHVFAPHALAPCVLVVALGLLVVVGCKVVHVCEAEPGMAHALRWCWGGVDGKGGGGGQCGVP
jgi:hypothetical protein